MKAKTTTIVKTIKTIFLGTNKKINNYLHINHNFFMGVFNGIIICIVWLLIVFLYIIH